MKSVLNQNFKSLSSTLLAGLLLVGVASVSNVTLTTEASAEAPRARPGLIKSGSLFPDRPRITKEKNKHTTRPVATPVATTPSRPARPASTRPARNPREFCLEFGAINFCHRK